jgi:hypothetical protein
VHVYFIPVSFFLYTAQIVNDRQNTSVDYRLWGRRRRIDIVIGKFRVEVLRWDKTVSPHWHLTIAMAGNCIAPVDYSVHGIQRKDAIVFLGKNRQVTILFFQYRDLAPIHFRQKLLSRR